MLAFSMKKILLIEDDLTYSKIIKKFLEKNEYNVITTTKLSEAYGLLERETPELIITDYRLPDGTGMEILEKVINSKNNTPVILITNYSDIRTAVKSMKMGAFEYITKPVNPDELLSSVNDAFNKRTMELNSGTSQPAKPASAPAAEVAGSFARGSRVARHIGPGRGLLAPRGMSVRVLRECGTGKARIARTTRHKR